MLLDRIPHILPLIKGILSDSYPSACLTRSKFIDQFKVLQRSYETENSLSDDDKHLNVIEIKCQAHSTALIEGTVIK